MYICGCVIYVDVINNPADTVQNFGGGEGYTQDR